MSLFTSIFSLGHIPKNGISRSLGMYIFSFTSHCQITTIFPLLVYQNLYFFKHSVLEWLRITFLLKNQTEATILSGFCVLNFHIENKVQKYSQHNSNERYYPIVIAYLYFNLDFGDLAQEICVVKIHWGLDYDKSYFLKNAASSL